MAKAPASRQMNVDTYRAQLAVAMSEDELQTHVLSALKTFGWRAVHFRPAVNRRGKWSTPVQGDGEGWPDIIAIRGDRGLAIELKSEGGTVEPAQWQWIDDFHAAGFTGIVWRPHNWLSGRINEVLR